MFFQTEWERDYHTEKYTCELPSILISQWQYRLSDLAQEHKVSIGLIGGCSDTIWLDQIEREYPGLYIACQSFTNLCINNNPRIDNPVLGLLQSPEIVENCKNTINDARDLESLLSNQQIGDERIQLWKSNPKWFWPNGMHANRAGHKKLYDYLKDTL